METRTTRVAVDLLEAAETEAPWESRSAREQLDHTGRPSPLAAVDPGRPDPSQRLRRQSVCESRAGAFVRPVRSTETTT